MTSAPVRESPRGNASVLVNVPGSPWWVAVLVAFVATVVGLGIDFGGSGGTGVIAWVFTLAGVAAATLLVRRHSLFTAMVQPPLVVAFAVIVAHLVVVSHRVLGVGLALVNSFPLMVAATAVALVLGLVRIVAQPMRQTSGRGR